MFNIKDLTPNIPGNGDDLEGARRYRGVESTVTLIHHPDIQRDPIPDAPAGPGISTRSSARLSDRVDRFFCLVKAGKSSTNTALSRGAPR